MQCVAGMRTLLCCKHSTGILMQWACSHANLLMISKPSGFTAVTLAEALPTAQAIHTHVPHLERFRRCVHAVRSSTLVQEKAATGLIGLIPPVRGAQVPHLSNWRLQNK